MGRFFRTVAMQHSLVLAGIVLAANVAANAAEPAPQAEPTAKQVTADPQSAAANEKAYTFADLPALKIFGNDRTAERLRALAAIKTTSADQVKGLIEARGGNHLALRTPHGDHTKLFRLKATDKTQVTLDGQAVKMMDLEPLQAACGRRAYPPAGNRGCLAP